MVYTQTSIKGDTVWAYDESTGKWVSYNPAAPSDLSAEEAAIIRANIEREQAAEAAEAKALAERIEKAERLHAEKEAAEAERLKREAEEAAKPPVYYDEKRDNQKIEQDIALERTKPALDVIAPVEVEEKITIAESRPEPVKQPTEKASWLDTFIFTIRSEFGKLLEMIQ